MGFSRISKSLVDIGRNLISVEFSRIPKLVGLGRFLRYINIGRNLRLIDPSRLSRFRFRV